MANCLLATTALTLSAGVAAADVTVSGDARMGIAYNGNATDEFRFDSRMRARISFSGETDSGMAFGGNFRLDQAGNAASGRMGAAASHVFISGEFGKLSMGDTMGAVQGAVGDLHGVGLTGLGFLNENTFLRRDFNGATGDTNALYTYSIDGLTVHASIGQLDIRTPAAGTVFGALALPGDASANTYGIGARYVFDGFAIGAGIERSDIGSVNIDHAAIGGEASFDMVTVRATYGQLFSDGKGALAADNQFGMSVSSTFDATTINAYARRDFLKDTHFGLGASYDLGAGARLVGGVRYTDFNVNTPAGDSSQTVADFGIAFSF